MSARRQPQVPSERLIDLCDGRTKLASEAEVRAMAQELLDWRAQRTAQSAPHRWFWPRRGPRS